LDFENQYLSSNSNLRPVAEAIKLMTHRVNIIKMVNNALKPKDTVVILDSIQRHLPSILEFDFSKNELGLEGSSCLAKLVPKMSRLKTLKLNGCNCGDRGLAMIIRALEEVTCVDHVSFQGNLLG
jgi:Ran GTPase-activating protein (RanGAP) involved in mRNA processing and transport